MEEQHKQRLEGEKQQGKHQQCEERRLERVGNANHKIHEDLGT